MTDELAFLERLLAWVERGVHDPLLRQREREDPVGLAREAGFARELLAVASEAALPPLGAAQRARAVRALREVRTRESEPGWRRLVASLVGGAPGSALALRRGAGGLSGGRFQALYEIDEFELDLHVAEDGALIGQLLSKDGGDLSGKGGIALLQTRGGELLTTAVEEGGEFYFAEAPREVVDLTVSLPRLEISVRDVDLLGT